MKNERHPDDPFYSVDRNVRRQILKQEERERKSGQWSPWEKIYSPGKHSGDPGGWTRDVHTIFKNGWCVVLVRDCKTAWGIVQHAAITTATNHELNWKEKQKLKDECFSPDATAIEVMPSAVNLVDAALMFHIWILPPDAALPFGLSDHDPCSSRHYRPDLPEQRQIYVCTKHGNKFVDACPYCLDEKGKTK